MLKEQGLVHADITELDLQLELEAVVISRNKNKRPALILRNIFLQGNKTILILKSGDLNNYITSFIGVLRDDYTNFLVHEMRGLFFNTATKVLEEIFNPDYET
jgi:hypothetical protein